MIPPCLFALFLLFVFLIASLGIFPHQKTTIDLAMEKFKRFWRLGLSGPPLIEVARFCLEGRSRGSRGIHGLGLGTGPERVVTTP